jgi:hypothetical protein
MPRLGRHIRFCKSRDGAQIAMASIPSRAAIAANGALAQSRRPLPAVVWQVADPRIAPVITALSFVGWLTVLTSTFRKSGCSALQQQFTFEQNRCRGVRTDR